MEIRYQPFCVYTKRFVVVLDELFEENRSFVDSFDPTYYSMLANHHAQMMERKAHANHLHATQLRVLYSQALETFFAYLFGCLQAPLCLVAWLHVYSRDALTKLTEVVTREEEFPYFKINIGHISWLNIARFLLPVDSSTPDKDQLLHNMAILIGSLSDDFVNPIYTSEYNSIKHGHRARPGGFALKIGKSPDSLKTIGQSPLGSEFLRISDSTALSEGSDATLFTLRRTHVNWDPHYFRRRIELMGNLLSNISSLIKVFHGARNKDTHYWVCEEDAEMRDYLLNRTGIQTLDFGPTTDLRSARARMTGCDHKEFYSDKFVLT